MDGGESGKVFENHLGNKSLKLMIYLTIFYIIVGGVLSIIADSIICLIAGLILGLLLILNMWWHLNIKTPHRIRIEPSGIILIYKSKKESSVLWDSVEYVRLSGTEPTGFLGIPPESALKIKGKLFPIPLTHSAATKIVDSYRDILNESPTILGRQESWLSSRRNSGNSRQ